MSASNKLHVDSAALGGITRGALPGSRKVYAEGVLHSGVRVPMREIQQTPTRHGASGETKPNAPVYVYDSSGPYTDVEAMIDLRKGLASIREDWILKRADTDALAGITSQYGRERLTDKRLDGLRFSHVRAPRVA
ncbi:MAG: phosphomethylpyrimidine synthase ThiC, partial [Myxococcaceae bacterium]